MSNHIEKLLKEPLLWACGLVLCIPLVGSKAMLSLRDALTFDSGTAEVVDLDRDLVSHTSPTSGSGSNTPNRSFPDNFGSTQPKPLPPLPSEPIRKSESGLEESLPISLPSSGFPELAANSSNTPTRDPGSLLDLTESGEYGSTSEPSFPTTDSNSTQSGGNTPSASQKKQEPEFDFLFGDESEATKPEPVPDSNIGGDIPQEIPKSDPNAIAGQQPEGLITPPTDDDSEENQFFSDSNDTALEPRVMQPPGIPQPLEFAQPQGIDHAPFGQALPALQPTPDIFHPTEVVTEAPVYSGQVVAAPHAAIQPQATWQQPVHVTPGYAIASGPIYQQVAPVAHVQEQTARNWTVGLTGLFFQRDYEDNVRLAYNAAGENLYTNDADERTFDGYGVHLASRTSGGRGFEASYWALNPGRASTSIAGDVTTTITGLDQLIDTSTGTNLYDAFSFSVAQNIVRDTDINNLELSLLRQGGSYCRWNRQGYRELFGGFRWFEFYESLQYATFTDNATYPNLPSEFYYNLQARNRLLGLQAGVRNELTFGPKLRFFSSVQGGIFNNNIRTAQNITDVVNRLAQVNGGPGTGRPFSYNDEKNDVAYLGELNFGFHWYLNCNMRFRMGYRVLGVSGVALAANQLPFRYDDPEELLRAKSNGNLLLNGGFYGFEFSF